ncbi:hypothetical protein FRB94_009064 [Tulasnella sp. JGI-2019a]|nr:hypothetical protein FRB94_009064 [Tulasnella sp. JGI-2019a]
MRPLVCAVLSLTFFLTALASPVGAIPKTESFEKRNNGDIIYLVTCNGQPHAETAAWYRNAADANQYGAHYPDSVTTKFEPAALNMGTYIFPDTTLTVAFEIINTDPGWFNYTGPVRNSYGTSYNCYMDNG